MMNEETTTIPTPTAAATARSMSRQVSKIDTPIMKVGIWGSSSNLMNAIVGAGIIGIPYSIKQSGLVFGIVLIVLVGYFTMKSLNMIIEVAAYHPKCYQLGILTYEDLMYVPFGKRGYNFVLINMFIMAYGAMVAYLLIIKDTIPTVLGLGNTFLEREVVMFLTSLVIIVPLSMLRDISQLSFTSFLSISADALLVVLIIIYSPYATTVAEAGGLGTVIRDNIVHPGLFIGLGVISTAMACQHSAFLISGTLSHHTNQRWNTVTALSLFIATAMSLLLGVFGYLGFLSNTQGDILLNFENTNLINIGRALLAITMFFTYPMESFVARHVVIQLRYGGNMDNTTIGPNGEVLPEKKSCGCCFGRREQITLALYIATLIPALILRDLGPVLSITGAIGASCISYIAPGLIYIGINGQDFCLWIENAIQYRKYSSSRTKATTTIEVELPVVGDVTATMPPSTNDHLDTTSSSTNYIASDNNTIATLPKPWWWYVTAMPLWFYIARLGHEGTNQFLHDLQQENMNVFDHHPPPPSDPDHNNQEETPHEIIGPCHRDYIFSICFIIFGTIAAIFGVISNIWVLVNNVFVYMT